MSSLPPLRISLLLQHVPPCFCDRRRCGCRVLAAFWCSCRHVFARVSVWVEHNSVQLCAEFCIPRSRHGPNHPTGRQFYLRLHFYYGVLHLQFGKWIIVYDTTSTLWNRHISWALAHAHVRFYILRVNLYSEIHTSCGALSFFCCSDWVHSSARTVPAVELFPVRASVQPRGRPSQPVASILRQQRPGKNEQCANYSKQTKKHVVKYV